MLGRDYASRISLHYTSKGKMIVIRIGDAEITKFAKEYYQINAVGDKLFFIPVDFNCGGRHLRDQTIIISSAPLIEQIQKFEGEYDVLRLDNETNYYYVDIKDMHEFSVIFPSKAGEKRNYPFNTKPDMAEEKIQSPRT